MLRKRLARFLDASGLCEALLRAGSISPAWMPVLNYHRIHADPERQPFDRGVIDATPAELEQQMSTLVRYFNPIGVNELADHVSHGKPLPPRPALVTFDDAYRECLTLALPILVAHGVRASFFVPTALVGGRRASWWDQISYILRSTRKSQVELHYPERLLLDLSAGAELPVRRLLTVFKRTYDIDVERLLGELAEAAGEPWNSETERRLAEELVLDWNGLRALRRAGMEIHSHTRTHRILRNLPPEAVDAELAGSREDIRDALGQAPRAISYPVGSPILDLPRLVERVQAAGYELGFSTGVGPDPSHAHPFNVGRMCLDSGTKGAEFRAMLVHPALLAA